MQNHSKHWFDSRLWQEYLALNWSIYTFDQGPLSVNSDSDCQRPLNSLTEWAKLAWLTEVFFSGKLQTKQARFEKSETGYLQQALIYKKQSSLMFLV